MPIFFFSSSFLFCSVAPQTQAAERSEQERESRMGHFARQQFETHAEVQRGHLKKRKKRFLEIYRNSDVILTSMHSQHLNSTEVETFQWGRI